LAQAIDIEYCEEGLREVFIYFSLLKAVRSVYSGRERDLVIPFIFLNTTDRLQQTMSSAIIIASIQTS